MKTSDFKFVCTGAFQSMISINGLDINRNGTLWVVIKIWKMNILISSLVTSADGIYRTNYQTLCRVVYVSYDLLKLLSFCLFLCLSPSR